MAATALEQSESALGAYLRRMKAKLGAPAAITATAHKLARLIYRLVKYGEAYVREGLDAYEKKFQEQRVKRLTKQAKALGFQLVQAPTTDAPVA